MKKLLMISLIGSLLLLLAGCASVPDLTDEQSEMVSEYAAALMLKYDSENHSRLVPIDQYVEQYELQTMINKELAEKHIEEIEKEQENARQEEEQRKEENQKQEQSLNHNQNNTPDNGSGNNQNADSDNNSSVGNDETVIIVDNNQNFDDITSIADYIGVEGFDIQYVGFSVMEVFGNTPDFTFPVGKGKKLLILQFSVKNVKDTTNELDVMVHMVSFKCSVDGDKYFSVGTDLEPTNLAFASGDKFKAGESKQYVLIGEIDENVMPNSMNLKLESGTKKAIVKVLR